MTSSKPHGPSAAVILPGVFLLLVGSLNMLWGIAAISDDSHFLGRELLVSTLSTWGWIYLFVGLIEVVVGILVFMRNPFGQIGGMTIAFLAILTNFVTVGVYPVWAIIAMVGNGLVLWLLSTHSEEFPD